MLTKNKTLTSTNDPKERKRILAKRALITKPPRDNNKHYGEMVTYANEKEAVQPKEITKENIEQGEQMLAEQESKIENMKKVVTSMISKIKKEQLQLRKDTKELLKIKKKFEKPSQAEIKLKQKEKTANKLKVSIKDLDILKKSSISVPTNMKAKVETLGKKMSLTKAEVYYYLVSENIEKYLP